MPHVVAQIRAAGAAGALLAAASAAAAPAPLAGSDLPARLGLADALRLAREHGFDLVLADAQVAGAEGDVVTAGTPANPVLGLSAGHSFDCAPGDTGCSSTAFGATLSDQAAIADRLSGKRGLRVDVARLARDVARVGRDEAWRQLELRVKQQVLAVLLAQRALGYAEEAREAVAGMRRLGEVRFRAGAIAEPDLVRVDVLALESEQNVDAGRQTLRVAVVGLAWLLGVRGPVPDLEIAEPELLRAREPSALAGATPAVLIAEAERARPDLRAAALQRERAAAAVALAERQRTPDVALQLGYAQQGTGPQAVTPPTATLGLSLPLPLLDRQEGAIARARADGEAQAAALARAGAQVAADVETAFAAYRYSLSQAVRAQDRLLERAQLARDLVEVQYRKGSASLLDYLDAERTYVANQLEYLNDLGAYWNAVFQLEAAVGRTLWR